MGFSPKWKCRKHLLWWICVDAIFLFEKLQLFFVLLCVPLPKCPVGVRVFHQKVSVTNLESWWNHPFFFIKDIFLHHRTCSGFGCVLHSYLMNRSAFPNYRFLPLWLCRENCLCTKSDLLQVEVKCSPFWLLAMPSWQADEVPQQIPNPSLLFQNPLSSKFNGALDAGHKHLGSNRSCYNTQVHMETCWHSIPFGKDFGAKPF